MYYTTFWSLLKEKSFKNEEKQTTMTNHCNLLSLKFMQIPSTLKLVSRCKTSHICMNSNQGYPTVLLLRLLLLETCVILLLLGNSDKELVKRLFPPSENFLDIPYKHCYIPEFLLPVSSVLPCLDMSFHSDFVIYITSLFYYFYLFMSTCKLAAIF